MFKTDDFLLELSGKIVSVEAGKRLQAEKDGYFFRSGQRVLWYVNINRGY
jgi:hypothetical protein